ncbi:acyltransferase family protein [Bacteroides fragilis]|uniref:acyltransferase family protein n=1 Tax=Bacteroides fragilis TaxID=817 RepID=UPI002030736E|nr:acyltransferase family protein [Bacteroides fragilis]MCM0342218.1 acyltransferase family protein [Bacteroides fragilis]
MQRNPNIDILKGIGILSVIIAHLTQIWLLRGLLYSFHMPLFFLASGYFFHYTSLPQLLRRISRQLLLPYLIFCTLQTIFILITGHLDMGSETMGTNLLQCLKMIIFADGYFNKTLIWGNIPPVAILWFLPAMFWCRIIYNIISRLQYSPLWAALISMISVYLGGHIINLPFGIFEGGQAVIFYMIGHQYAQHQKSTRRISTVVLTTLWLLAFLFSYMSMADFSYGFWPLNVVGAAGGTWVVYNFAQWLNNHFNRISNELNWLGRNSLYIFGIHAILMILQGHIFTVNKHTWLLAVIVQLTIAILLTLLYNKTKKALHKYK